MKTTTINLRLFSMLLLLITLGCAMQKLPIDELNKKSQLLADEIDNRSLSIYLPPNYDKDSTYKTLYFNDGQSLFNGGWNLNILLDELIESKTIEAIIVVGIHSDANRNSDLIPYQDQWIVNNWGLYNPNAKDFSKFIKEKIVPYVEANYAIKKGKENRGLAGVSLGGLFAMWEQLENPNFWGTTIAMSPSFWVADFEIFNTLSKSKNLESKVWFDIGATTGEWNYYVPVIEILKTKKLTYGKSLFYYEDPQGRHDSNSWSNRIKYPLILFAGAQNFSPKEMKIEIEVIKSSQSNIYFQRINPIIYLENEMIFSASNQAKYELINARDGQLETDGRFRFNSQKDLEVKVSYKNLTQNIIINYEDVQRQKR